MYLELNPDFEFARGFLQQVDLHFEAEKVAIHVARNTIKKLSFASHDLIVKSFGVPNIFNQLAYCFFRDTKARRSFQNALRLISFHIATATPVAFCEGYHFGLIQRSYYISLRVDYDYDFHDINFERKPGSEKLFKQFAEFTHVMHKAGFLHLDYTPGNILIKEKESNFYFTLIDINRMKIGPVSWRAGVNSLGKIYFKEAQMKIVSHRYAELAGIPETMVWATLQKSRQAFERKKKIKQFLRFWQKKN